jgi:hypothetical protein
MKARPFLSLFVATILLVSRSSGAQLLTEVTGPPFIQEEGAHQRVWSRITTRERNGQLQYVTNSFVQLQTGLNRWSALENKWVESSDEIELFLNGAIARKTAHQVIFAPTTIDPNGTIDLLMPDGIRLRWQVIGLAYTEENTGTSVFVGEVVQSNGQLVGRNEVIYPSAFDNGIQADIRYTQNLSGLEQDIILRKQLPDPREFGLDPARTKIECWSEVLESPEPARKVVPLNRTNFQEADEVLDFGAMHIGAGKAFNLNFGDNDQFERSIPVGKSWQVIEARVFIVEAIPYAEASPFLNSLPLAENRADRKIRYIAKGKTDKKQVRVAARKAKPTPKDAAIKKAAFAMAPGFVIDFSTVSSSSNQVFRSDTTYYVSGTVNLTGTVTWEGGAVIKYTNSTSAKINLNGSVDVRSAMYRPITFTSKDDDSIGEVITGSTNNPSSNDYGNPMLYTAPGTYGSLSFSNLRMAHAKVAIDVSGVDTNATGQIFNHAQFVDCQTGINLSSSKLVLRNALFYNVLTNIAGSSSTGICEHLTVNSATWFNYNNACNPLNLTNSLLVAVSNTGTNSGTGNATYASESGVFQQIGAAKHYLANQSTNRNAGTTSINVSLQGDLKQRTTYSPIVTSDIWVDYSLTLFPQAQRDTDTPDRGFHYAPLDYVYKQIGLTNATFTVKPGTAIGAYGASSSYAIGVFGGGGLVVEGNATNLVHFARYNLVQEQATTNWSASSVSPFVITPWASTSPTPVAKFTFTDWNMPAGGDHHFYGYGGLYFSIPFKDCQFYGGKFYSEWPEIYATNCLFHRVYVNFIDLLYGTNQIAFYNNLLYRGTLDLVLVNGSVWTFKDNYFDQTSITDTNAAVTANYNGYQSGYNRFYPNGANDVVLSSTLAYETSTLGSFYQPTNSTLVNAGSRTAPNAGLYHYTVLANQTKEGTNTVDIGFHYVAVSSGLPVDTDGDGTPDYQEDTNGNGSLDSGETKTNDANDLGLKVIITQPKSNSNIP